MLGKKSIFQKQKAKLNHHVILNLIFNTEFPVGVHSLAKGINYIFSGGAIIRIVTFTKCNMFKYLQSIKGNICLSESLNSIAKRIGLHMKHLRYKRLRAPTQYLPINYDPFERL